MGLATREAYGQELAKLITENEKIVVLDADLTKSTKTIDAKKACPERHFNMGIAEANMIGVAAGFASSGYTVFASSFAMFAVGRSWEQIRNSVAYPHLNVKVCGTHAGIAVGEDGVSHQAIEDIAITRSIPGFEVYCPCDEAETRAIVRYVATTKNPCYVRLGRSSVDEVYPADYKFEIGKVNEVRKGSKVVVLACGLMVQESLKAAELLKADGIDLAVVNVSCIKPLDEAGIENVLKSYDVIFTAEEHNVMGGLGSAVAEVSTSTCPKLIHRIGIQDRFAESGVFNKLLHKYELDAEGIAKQIKAVL